LNKDVFWPALLVAGREPVTELVYLGMVKACLFLLIVLPLFVAAQKDTPAPFKQSIVAINAICKKIDANTTLLKAHVEFTNDGENFAGDGYCYYAKPAAEVKKFVYNNSNNGVTAIIFYYYNKTPVKIVDGTAVYYYTDSLRYKNGIALPDSLAKSLVAIAKSSDNLPSSIFRK